MTEQEAKKILERLLSVDIIVGNEHEAVSVAIKALENMQKLEENKTYHLYREYLSLGTVEELRALKEKQIAKKPIENEIYGVHTSIFCPNCESELYCNQEYCDKCGQKILWKRELRGVIDDY